MPNKETLLNELIELAVADTRDDISVPRHVALSRQHLSPAASPNAERQARFVELMAHFTQDEYPEIDRRFDAALATVTHFDSGAPFQRLPRIVLHVGPGLERFCTPGDEVATRRALRERVRDIAELAGVHETLYERASHLLIAPEVLRTEAAAAIEVLRQFHAVRQHGTSTVLAVVTFSQGLVMTLVNALVALNLHRELLICLHGDNEGLSVHGMDDEGFLEHWPYGVLDTNIDKSTLQGLGFDVPSKRL